MKKIEEFQGEYRWLSNFAPVEVILEGKKYPSVEHAYMSAKCDSKEWKDICQDINVSAGQVKKMSRGIVLKKDWESIKVGVMSNLLFQKYSTSPYRELLSATKDDYIQEGNRWGDKFWGVCLKSGEGLNILGHLIILIRKTLTTDEL